MTYIILGVLVALVLWVIISYNSLVKLVTRTKEAWADIEVQLKRRYDLIPNLVNTVKGYATHETSAFENVTKARAAAMGASSMTDHGKAENMLTGALKSLFAVSEAYPALRASENFLHLQTELTAAEDKIAAARRFYNGLVRDLNTAIEQFPAVLIARSLGFGARDFFEMDEAEREVPKVNMA